MAKSRTQFLCNQCGCVHPKWMGKCPDCGTWDSLEEYKAPDGRTPGRRPALDAGGADRRPRPRAREALTLDEIDEAEPPAGRPGIGEFDRILGGGIVPGSAVLVGGEPGIGKSTLLLQVAQNWREAEFRVRVRRQQEEAAPRHRGFFPNPELDL